MFQIAQHLVCQQHPIASNRIQSHPIASNRIRSHPIASELGPAALLLLGTIASVGQFSDCSGPFQVTSSNCCAAQQTRDVSKCAVPQVADSSLPLANSHCLRKGGNLKISRPVSRRSIDSRSHADFGAFCGSLPKQSNLRLFHLEPPPRGVARTPRFVILDHGHPAQSVARVHDGQESAVSRKREASSL